MSDQSPQPSVEVQAYSIGALKTCLRAPLPIGREDVIDGLSPLFEEHLAEIKAATMVVEVGYTDRDFLHDYAAYYVYCLNKYRSRCTRIHFFSSDFDQSKLDKASLAGSNERPDFLADEHYLGFMVIKPLPSRVIGRTCLRPYPRRERTDTQGERDTPTVREYSAHLMGFDFHLESLAWQQQDKVVAACATSAMWSAFQATGKHFGHAMPSPVEITRLAADSYVSESRDLPSPALTVRHMAGAIRRVGLEPEKIGFVSDIWRVKALAYAHLRAKVPPILRVNTCEFQEEIDPDNEVWMRGEAHAITLVGYCMSATRPTQSNEEGPALRSDRIDRLLVHDDLFGPFARCHIRSDEGVKMTLMGGAESSVDLLEPNYLQCGDADRSMRYLPSVMLLPLYPKMRIDFNTVYREVKRFDGVFDALWEELSRDDGGGISPRPDFEWDIFLSTESSIKKDLAAHSDVRPDDRIRLLKWQMPRYVWRAIAYEGERRVVEFMYDATDVAEGDFLQGVIAYEDGMDRIRRLFDLIDKQRSAVLSEEIVGKPPPRWWIRFNNAGSFDLAIRPHPICEKIGPAI